MTTNIDRNPGINMIYCHVCWLFIDQNSRKSLSVIIVKLKNISFEKMFNVSGSEDTVLLGLFSVSKFTLRYLSINLFIRSPMNFRHTHTMPFLLGLFLPLIHPTYYIMPCFLIHSKLSSYRQKIVIYKTKTWHF